MTRTRSAALSIVMLAVVVGGTTTACSSNSASSTTSASPSVTVSASPSTSASVSEPASSESPTGETTTSPESTPTGTPKSESPTTEEPESSECNDVQTLVSQNTGSIGTARMAVENGDTDAAIEALKGAEASVSAMIGGLGGSAPGSGQEVLTGLQSMASAVANGAAEGQTPEQMLATIQGIDSGGSYQQGWSDLRAALEAKCPGLTF